MRRPIPRYFTHAHNIEGCLRNGSFVRQTGQKLVQYINGDFMGEILAVPESMTEVDAALALRLLPKVCGGKS